MCVQIRSDRIGSDQFLPHTFPRGLSLAKKSASAMASPTNCRRQCRASDLSLLISHSSASLPTPTALMPLPRKPGGPIDTAARLALSSASSSHQRVLARIPPCARKICQSYIYIYTKNHTTKHVHTSHVQEETRTWRDNDRRGTAGTARAGREARRFALNRFRVLHDSRNRWYPSSCFLPYYILLIMFYLSCLWRMNARQTRKQQ